VIRPRGGTTRRRDDEEDDAASSAEEIGRLLRASREERGLDLLTVHDRLGRPITQIEALEKGDLATLPDQAMALSTLRRYAAFLGLDGDALALQMIDAFSTVPAAAPRPGPADAATSSVATVVTAGPDHLRAFTQTGEVPKFGGGSSGPPAGSGAFGYGIATGPPTGTFPVVPRHDLKHSRRAVARARRRLRAPTTLKTVTWVVAALVVVAAAGLVIYRSKPRWLVQAHILRVVQPGGAPSAAKTSTTQPGQPGPSKAQVLLTSSDGASASYTVAAKQFVVAVVTSGRCWVQITSSTSSDPLVSGVQPGGKSLSIPASGTMTVEVGSSAVVVGVKVGTKLVFYNAPGVVPFTYTFAPAAVS
jgi:hypothetical protein